MTGTEFASFIKVKVFPSGERRVILDPPRPVLIRALDELGTYSQVALAFGVDRRVVTRWMKENFVSIPSRPEVKIANNVRDSLSTNVKQMAMAQWLMDEGSVSVCYFGRTDQTILLACGSMNDHAVLSRIASLLNVAVSSSKNPSGRTLPMGAVRVQGARAYALLQLILPFLEGLKAMEARAALGFFPPAGKVGGRHTTDEFLLPIWEAFAIESLRSWNSHRIVKESSSYLEDMARTWVEGRVRRARRFVDAAKRQPMSS